jgi:transposase
VTCPQGQHSRHWRVYDERIEVEFSKRTCADGPVRADCTRAQETGRVVHLRHQAAHEALQARRHAQHTPEFRQAYQARAGIEGTVSQGVRRMGLRRSRYLGLPKTQLQHILTAVAINLVRIDDWLCGRPPGQTYRSPLALLASHPLLQRHAA